MVLSASISGVAIILIFFLTREELSITIFKEINLYYLLVAFLLTFGFWLIRSLRLRVLVESLGEKVSIFRIFSICMASAFAAHVTPSSTGGLPFEIYFIHREGLPVGKSTALTITDNMFSLIFFLIVSPVLLFWWGDLLNPGPEIRRFFYIAAVVIALFAVVSIFFIFNVKYLLSFLERLFGFRIVKRFVNESKLSHIYDFFEREVGCFHEGIQILLKEKGSLFWVFFYTVFYWVFHLSLAPVLLIGMGVNISLPPVILAQIIFNFIHPLFPTPGGSGGAELGFAYLFKFMIPGYLLGVFVVIWRFFVFYISLITGGIFFIKLIREVDYFQGVELE